MIKIRIISKCYKHLILISLVIFIKGLIADAIQNTSLESSDLSLCSNLSLDNIDCSKQNFSLIPINLPKNAISLNFSFNNLRFLTDDTFHDCCSNITTIDLSNNNIQHISSSSFKNLLKLKILILNSNLLTLLDFNLFFNLTSLESLSLSNNRIQLTRADDTEGFLNSKSLLELNLDNCNIDQIPLNTFKYINQLKSLNLANNPINKRLEVASFKPLESSLEHLHLPNITDQSVFEICDKLTAVDIIHFETKNISCLLLVEATNLNEGIDVNDPDHKIDEPKINFVLQSTKFETKRVTEDIIPIIRLPEVSNPTMKNETIKNGMNLNTHVPLDNQDITIITTTTTTTSDIEMEKSTFDISNETLKMVLIGIFAVAVFGVVLGIVCRYCGIKSKLCHSSKKRITNADTVVSFEMENLNGNGKSSPTIA